MSESVIRPDANHEDNVPSPSEQTEIPTEEQDRSEAQIQEMTDEAETSAQKMADVAEDSTPVSAEKIIWTPGFLLTFALVLVLGLSAEGLFAQGWHSNLFKGQWIILGHVILVALGWLGLGIVTPSRWVRIGCIFGGICTAFMTLNIFINMQGMNSNTPVLSTINVATCLALFGAYIGLSIEDTLRAGWDTWLFFLAPFLGVGGIILLYFFTPRLGILTLENLVAGAALISCCLLWWLRPSCWKERPGPTFIFGLVPVILLIAALLNTSTGNFFLLQVANPRTNSLTNLHNFFFAQVILLCLFLGCMRMAKKSNI